VGRIAGVALLADARRVRAQGFDIGNVAIDHRQPAQAGRSPGRGRQIMSEAIDAPVSLSATTSDGLGLTGRGEGVAAIATVLVYFRPLLAGSLPDLMRSRTG
jgi:2-C-methyl-D-erythritol 2,4-cyclodiphosphate synthase